MHHVGIDTNVFLTYFLPGRPYRSIVKELFKNYYFVSDHPKVKFFVSEVVIEELFRNLTGTTCVAKPLDTKTALKTIEIFFFKNTNVSILKPHGRCMNAFSYMKDRKLGAQRFRDTLIAMELRTEQVDNFWTQNEKDFKCFSELKLLNAKELSKKLDQS